MQFRFLIIFSIAENALLFQGNLVIWKLPMATFDHIYLKREGSVIFNIRGYLSAIVREISKIIPIYICTESSYIYIILN